MQAQQDRQLQHEISTAAAPAALIFFQLIFMLELETGVDCGIGSGSMSAMGRDLGTKCARAFS
jgi:hypothetical protein